MFPSFNSIVYIFLLSLAFFHVCVRATSSSSSSSSPQIIISFIFDDLGYHDLGFTGSLIRTPTLDRLHREGIALDNYYVTPICTPSRSSFLTGKHQFSLGLQGGLTVQPEQTWGLNTNETIIPKLLGSSNITSHAVGKSHIGYAYWEQTPTFRGFQSFYGYYLGAEDYFTHSLGPGNGYDLHDDRGPNCGPSCSIVDWSANGTYSVNLFTSKVQALINNYDPSTGPLYLYVAWQSVHAPIEAPSSYVEPYKTIFNDTIRQIHAGALTVLDEGIQNITDTLAAKGYLDNSVLIFTTDNGGPSGVSCGDCNGALNYPLRGGKHTLYQGGVLGTAFIWSKLLYGTSSPNGQQNRSYNGLMHITDWLPTILSWFQVPLPSYEIHGYDQTGPLALAGQCIDSNNCSAIVSPRKYAILNIDPTCNGTAAMVQDEWKLIMGDPGPPYGWDPMIEYTSTEFSLSLSDFHMYRNADGKNSSSFVYVPSGTAPGSPCNEAWPPTPPVTRLWPLHNDTIVLYNITADPREMNDVSSLYPDVVNELTAIIAEWATTKAIWPVQNGTMDPRGASTLHNHSWVPWL